MNYSAESASATMKVCEKKSIRTATEAAALFAKWQGKKQEHFLLATFDGGRHLIKVYSVFIGTLNYAPIHPREIFRRAILDNAASIIVAHNHPSGNATPSEEDRQVTRDLKEAGRIIGIELTDHIIITKKNGFFSFAGNGIL